MTTSRKRPILFLFFILILAAVAGCFILPKAGKNIAGKFITPDLFLNRYAEWRLGLDLVGGSALVYDIDLSGVEAGEYATVVGGLKDVIEKRINLYGVSEPKTIISKRGDHYQLIVELAGAKDLGEAVKQIGETPVLNFMDNCRTDGEVAQCDKTPLTGKHIVKAGLDADQLGRETVAFELNSEGAKLFEEITGRNVGKQLCIFIDNNFIFPDDPSGSCPMVNEKISGGKAQISGEGITAEVAVRLVERFNAGALSAPIKLVNQRTVNATAAQDSLAKMLAAGAVGTLLVMLFMVGYYRGFGLVASLALIIYIMFSLSVFKLVPNFTMSLAGIAGFILSVGMAVDANILIFERTKEELKKGLLKVEAIEAGFKRAWPSIRDSNISTIISSLILYYLTSSFVKGFALTLMFGVLVSMFSAITVTRTILRVLARK
jgi:preprotein translocase subunit SecD